MQEQTWWKLHCASCLLVFCAVVWWCWCWLRSEWWKKNIQIYPYYNCTFHQQNSQRKQTNFTIPTNLIENFDQYNLLYVSLSACWKTGEKLCKNTAWWKLHCASCLLVFCAVVWFCWCWLRSEWGKKSNPNTIHIITALFHHQNSQRKQTSFTVPTDLIENFGQHNLLYVYLSACWKTEQKSCKNKHGENCVAQVVCWYFVRLCGTACVGYEVSDEKKTSKPIHILTALFTTRIHKENKQILPYQPTSGKLWPT